MLKEEAGGVGTFYFPSLSLIQAQPLSFAHFAIARRDKDQDHAQRSRDGTHEKEGGEDLVHPSNRYAFPQCLFFNNLLSRCIYQVSRVRHLVSPSWTAAHFRW